MKELTIEQKAKAYDEAIEKAKDYYHLGDDKHKMAIDAKAVMEYIFPELKESEDEKVRKWLIGYLENRILNCSLIDEKENCKTAVAWLEKQGKTSMGISEATKQKLEDKLHEALEKETPESFNKFLDEQDEQKPAAWSEEDEFVLKDAIMAVDLMLTSKFQESNPNLYKSFEVAKHWLKSLKERYTIIL